MHQNRASFGYGLVNEPARGGEVNKEIRMVNIFDWNPQLPDPASRDVGWDGIRAYRHDVGDPPFGDSSRGSSGNQAIRNAR